MTDCDECKYKAQGSHSTICCMYYGAEKTDPDGDNCDQFCPKNTISKDDLVDFQGKVILAMAGNKKLEAIVLPKDDRLAYRVINKIPSSGYGEEAKYQEFHFEKIEKAIEKYNRTGEI